MLISGYAMAQEPVDSTQSTAAQQPEKIFFPDMEIADADITWSSLEKGKFYEISLPGEWAVSADGEQEGYFAEQDPSTKEYISINDDEDVLTWLTVKQQSADCITDSTTARAIHRDYTESVYTADISDAYLDIVGTQKGRKIKSRNFQLAIYAGKYAVYDYNNKILRLLDIGIAYSLDNIVNDNY